MRTPRFISRRIPAIILALVMVFSLSSLTAFADPVDDKAWYDDNPDATEFYIGTAEELFYLATLVSGANGLASAADNPKTFAGKTITLTADIDLAGYADYDGGLGWIPIGSLYSGFAGTFDGAGHIVSNVTVNRTSVTTSSGTTGSKGFFGRLENGVVRNLGLVNVDIAGGGSTGGLVGHANRDSVIENCFVTGKVVGETNMIGGLVGFTVLRTAIRNCYANVDVTSAGTQVGGLIGSQSSGTITNSYATGTVTANASSSIGGISGSTAGTLGIEVTGNVSLLETISGGASAARIAGPATIGSGPRPDNAINNYAWDGMTINGVTRSSDDPNDYKNGADVSANDIYSANVWTLAGFSSDVWDIEAGRLPALKAFSLAVQPTDIPAYIPFTPATPSITLTGDVGVNSGEDARYAISASNISKLATVTAWFESDDAFLTAKEFNGLNDFSVLGDVVTTEEDGKTISQVTFISSEIGGKDITAATEILEAIFSTSADVSGDTAVKLIKVTLSGYDEENVAVFIEADIESDTVETSIELSFSIYDVNRDGTVDQLDLTTAQLYYQAGIDDANWNIAQRADVNSDESVDIADFILILNNIVW